MSPARRAPDQVPYTIPDSRGNRVRREGYDRCACGCKYWENDRCIDCGSTEPLPEEEPAVSTFDTGYIGAHRWHVEEERGAYRYTCVCGDTGRVAGNLSFLLHEFGGHANRKLEQAAVALLEPHLKSDSYHLLQDLVEIYRNRGERDAANLLQMVANNRYQEGGES